MKKAGLACCLTMTPLLGAIPSAARSQDFVPAGTDCVSLECAIAAKSYSFEKPSTAQDSQRAAPASAGKTSSGYVREGVWHKLPGNFVHDQKDMWVTYPKKLAQGHYWLPTVLLTGATAALIYMDPKTMPYFRQTDFFQDSDRALGAKTYGAVIAAVPAVFYIVGLARNDPYAQGTSLLAGEAVVDDTILMIVAKAITRRETAL